MKRIAACTALLGMTAPLPLLASESAVLTSEAEAGPVIEAAASGALRLVYIEAPPPVPQTRFPAKSAKPGHPPQRPVIALAAACGWENRNVGLAETRSAFAAAPLWLLEPDGQDCDPAELRAAFEAAAAVAENDRLAVLLASGLKLSEVEASFPSSAQATGKKGSLGGQLVISSLPAGSSLGGGAPLLISAGEPAEEIVTDTGATTGDASIQPAVMATVPGGADKPEPAVVVGELASLLAADKRNTTGVPRDVRDRIREIDPAFFMTLLELGNFDPDQDQSVAAIQTELSGMNCYSGNIDGDWGPGSLNAMGRYYSELGEAQQEETPGIALYREIATHPSVTCPAPVVTVRANPVATPSRSGGTTTPRSGGGNSRNSGVRVGPNVSIGQNVRIGGQPATPTPTPQATTNAAPRIDPSLLSGAGGAGIIK